MENKFKGNIKTGKIAIKFLSDFSNVDADLLTASYADSTGGSIQIGHPLVAPGGFGEVSISDTPALDAFQATKMIRASMSIPLVKGAGISLNLAKPLDSGGSPIITVSFNWGLLLSDRPGR